jgi:hypothetical protein
MHKVQVSLMIWWEESEVTSTQSDPEVVRELSEAIVSRQGTRQDEAQELAAQIAEADSDIVELALDWARTGVLREEPEVDGWTAPSLASRFDNRATFAITALMALRSNPDVAHEVLAHSGFPRLR